jgi:hypothetical protein
MQLQLTVFLQNVLAGEPGTSKSMHESSIYEVDDIFEAIMSLNASSDLELGLQNVTCKSKTQYLPIPKKPW